VCKHKTEVDY